MKTRITNARLIFPHRISGLGWLEVIDGKIHDLGLGSAPSSPADLLIDAEGQYLSPGFVDIHVHGGMNGDFRDAEEAASLRALQMHLAGGTTTIFPTISSSSAEETLESIHCFNRMKQQESHYTAIPNLAGIHLEGPYFSPQQLGAQDGDLVREPKPEEYRKILDSTVYLRRWSIACELPGALVLGRLLYSQGIQASIGHSNATTAQAFEAFENGYHSVTHLYSSCSIVHRNGPFREGGVVEAAFLLDELDAEVICDGVHLPPDFLKLIFKIKGADHVALITDCIRAGGLTGDDTQEVYDDKARKHPILIESGVAILPDRKSFAGSIATTGRLVRTAWKEAGIPLTDAVRMASLTPARMQNIDHLTGSIARGKRADLVLFDEDVQISMVMANGDVRKR